MICGRSFPPGRIAAGGESIVIERKSMSKLAAEIYCFYFLQKINIPQQKRHYITQFRRKENVNTRLWRNEVKKMGNGNKFLYRKKEIYDS